jgi:hypothetical protein
VLLMQKVFVGHDWAEDHHDVFVEDQDGRRLDGGRLPDGVEGVARFHELVAGHVDDPGDVVVATETDRGLFVGALVAAGYTVLAVNPLSVSRYRERHSTSGAKSDPGDAKVLADLARTDAHNHRPIAGDSELAEAVKVLARSHQSLIWSSTSSVRPCGSSIRQRSTRSTNSATATLSLSWPWPRHRRWDASCLVPRSPRRCDEVAGNVASSNGLLRSRWRCVETTWPPRTWSLMRWAPPSQHSWRSLPS